VLQAVGNTINYLFKAAVNSSNISFPVLPVACCIAVLLFLEIELSTGTGEIKRIDTVIAFKNIKSL